MRKHEQKTRSFDWLARWASVLICLFLGMAAFAQVPTTYPGVRPTAAQKATLQGIGPVVCDRPVNLTFETAWGFWSWLKGQEAIQPGGNGPGWALLKGDTCRVTGWEDQCFDKPVLTQGRAGAIVFDVLRPGDCDGLWSARSGGPTGGHSTQVLEGYWALYGPMSGASVAQWARALAHHRCGTRWCVDPSLVLWNPVPAPPGPVPPPPSPPPVRSSKCQRYETYIPEIPSTGRLVLELFPVGEPVECPRGPAR